METPSPQALLDVLEGRADGPGEQALDLLLLAAPDADRDQLRSLPVGERDRRLARLRGRLFGHRCDSVVACPACGERLEFDLDCRVLFDDVPTPDSTWRALSVSGYALRFRPPNSGDLLAVSALPDLGEARAALLQRCIGQAVGPDGEAVDPARLPEAVETAVEEAMEQADPAGNTTLLLDCPACGHHWRGLFDILSYFLLELQDWARRLFWEVHALARAYGWSERDILAMSAWRRRTYLEMLET